jgi:hypothetical protein
MDAGVVVVTALCLIYDGRWDTRAKEREKSRISLRFNTTCPDDFSSGAASALLDGLRKLESIFVVFVVGIDG